MTKIISAEDINISKAFYMEPEEIVNYFQSKGLKTSYNWQEVYQEAHAKAFTVAKMTNVDLLNDTHNMLTTAIKEGWSEGHFKTEASALFEKKGWTGFQKMTNPNTGKEETVELGTPRRIKTIFQTNMTTSYAAGRYKQQLEDVDIAPYFQYKCVLDSRTRPAHRAMNDLVFRYDDPIWQSCYPPNGWRCRCYVNSLSGSEIKSKNLTVDNSDGHLRNIETTADGGNITGYDFKLGDKQYTLAPDAGFSTNVGANPWNIDVVAFNKAVDLPQPIKDKFISDMAQNPYNEKCFQNFITNSLKNGLKTEGLSQTLTWIKPELLNNLKSQKITPKTPIIIMQDDRIGHTINKKVNEAELRTIYSIINNPDAIYYDYTRKDFVGLDYIKKVDNNYCIKVCVSLNNIKSKIPVNRLSTIGKVDIRSLNDKKLFKKIE